MKLFEDVLKKRFPAGLLATGNCTKISLLSGEVMRELMRLAREFCTECMIELDVDLTLTDLQIDDQILKAATGNLRDNFAREMGSQSLYDIAAQVYVTSKSVEGDGFTKLLHSLMILEYENGALWYDVHPLVLDLLHREKMIAAPTD